MMERSPDSRLTLTLLRAGMIGAPLFVVAFLVEGVVRPGHDALCCPVSSELVGAGGWANQASFRFTRYARNRHGGGWNGRR
jgi:hypothetical protein